MVFSLESIARWSGRVFGNRVLPYAIAGALALAPLYGCGGSIFESGKKNDNPPSYSSPNPNPGDGGTGDGGSGDGGSGGGNDGGSGGGDNGSGDDGNGGGNDNGDGGDDGSGDGGGGDDGDGGDGGSDPTYTVTIDYGFHRDESAAFGLFGAFHVYSGGRINYTVQAKKNPGIVSTIESRVTGESEWHQDINSQNVDPYSVEVEATITPGEQNKLEATADSVGMATGEPLSTYTFQSLNKDQMWDSVLAPAILGAGYPECSTVQINPKPIAPRYSEACVTENYNMVDEGYGDGGDGSQVPNFTLDAAILKTDANAQALIHVCEDGESHESCHSTYQIFENYLELFSPNARPSLNFYNKLPQSIAEPRVLEMLDHLPPHSW